MSFGAHVTDVDDAASLFEREYERIARDVYVGALPPFPGVVIVDRRDVFSETSTLGRGRWRRLEPFVLSSHLTGALLVEAIRHEIAHAAALLFDEDEAHGPAWREHARRCGARDIPTLEAGHALRREWDAG